MNIPSGYPIRSRRLVQRGHASRRSKRPAFASYKSLNHPAYCRTRISTMSGRWSDATRVNWSAPT